MMDGGAKVVARWKKEALGFGARKARRVLCQCEECLALHEISPPCPEKRELSRSPIIIAAVNAGSVLDTRNYSIAQIRRPAVPSNTYPQQR